ncbi:ATP synthase F1 subunit gamma [Odoribacter sp. OttesenSCG-928-G04]|nr:ATP synthase F1 subunit gamma [Odoribacter sp. OttesenSCG-928-G04]
MAAIRELKRRLGSVQSSQKITGAMRMIASARLQKVENALKSTLPFEEQLQSILNHINPDDYTGISPLGEVREVNNIALIALGSDEGLNGSFNINVVKKATEFIHACRAETLNPVQVFVIGKRLRAIQRIPNIELNEVPAFFAEKKIAEGAQMLVSELIQRFLKKEIDRVEVIYTHYQSMGSQAVNRIQLLPLLPKKETTGKEQLGADTSASELYYIYEPDAGTIIEKLYPLIVQIMFYKCVLESKSSEEAMRVISMQTANDNANKLIEKLQLEYNKLRQQSITTELLDIAGGATKD